MNYDSKKDLKNFLQSRYGSAHLNKITPYERVNTALKHKEPDRVPFDFWAVPEIKDKMKKYLQVDRTEEILKLLGSDCRKAAPDYVGPAPIARADGNYIDRWGTIRKKVKNRSGGVYEEYAEYPLARAETPGEIRNWKGWPVIEHWDFSDLEQKIEKINSQTRYHIRFELGGIFELAWGLYGLQNFLTDLINRPELPCAIMDKFTKLFMKMAQKALDNAGGKIDLMYTYDDIGMQSNLLLSPDMWEKFILPRHQKLNEVIRSHPDSPAIMYHSCGAVYPLIEKFKEKMGIDILNPLQPRAAGMDMCKIKRNFGDELSFHGAIDLQETLPRGTKSEVRSEVKSRCKVLGEKGGYICAPAHHIQSDTPVENIIAMYTAAREI